MPDTLSLSPNWGLIGHTAAVASLALAIEQDRLAQAWLIAGPAGIGKGTLALRFAQALNCREPLRPSGSCSTCRRIDAGNHPDVTALALEPGQRELSIDLIRDLEHSAHL